MSLGTRLFLLFYSCFYPVAYALYWPFYRRKLQRRGGELETIGERRGYFSHHKRSQLRDLTRPIWIHAVSVGELNAALLLIDAWRAVDRRRPFVISTTTNTAQRLARERAPDGCEVIYAPLDLPSAIDRTLDQIEPRMLVIMEVELWPQLILRSSQRVPVVIANARMSDNSLRGFSPPRRRGALPAFSRHRCPRPNSRRRATLRRVCGQNDRHRHDEIRSHPE